MVNFTFNNRSYLIIIVLARSMVSDFWVYDSVKWTQLSSGPGQRESACMVYNGNDVSPMIVLYGGAITTGIHH